MERMKHAIHDRDRSQPAACEIPKVEYNPEDVKLVADSKLFMANITPDLLKNLSSENKSLIAVVGTNKGEQAYEVKNEDLKDLKKRSMHGATVSLFIVKLEYDPKKIKHDEQVKSVLSMADITPDPFKNTALLEEIRSKNQSLIAVVVDDQGERASEIKSGAFLDALQKRSMRGETVSLFIVPNDKLESCKRIPSPNIGDTNRFIEPLKTLWK